VIELKQAIMPLRVNVGRRFAWEILPAHKPGDRPAVTVPMLRWATVLAAAVFLCARTSSPFHWLFKIPSASFFMFCYRNYSFALNLSLALTVPLHAVELPDIVVTATRTPQTQGTTVVPVEVISKETLNHSPAFDINDILRFHSGLEIGRTGGPGQAASVFMRGLDSNHTLVLLDGIKLNPATIGGAALHNINPALLQRVEIVKGPRSSLYGAEAMGGVIQLLTTPTHYQKGTRTESQISGSRYDTYQLDANLLHQDTWGHARMGFAHLRSQGFPTRHDSDLNSAHDNTNFNLGASLYLGDLEIAASHFQAQGNTAYLDYFLTPQDQDYRTQVSRLTVNAALNPQWDSQIQLGRMEDKIIQQQSMDFAHTERLSVEWQNDWRLNAHHLVSAGIHLTREKARSLIFAAGFEVDIDSHAVFIQDDYRSANHHFTAGLRYTHHEAFAAHGSGSFDYAYHFTPSLRLMAGIGSAYRAPDATDRFGYGGNPELNPEVSYHAESGVQWRPDTHQQWDWRIFYTQVHDLITFHDPDGYQGALPGQNQNLDRARNRGSELTYARQDGAWHTVIGAVWQQPRNRDNGRALARRADYQLKASTAYHQGAITWRTDILHSGKRRDSDFSEHELSAYSLLNLSFNWNFAPSWAVFAKLENALAEEYELAQGYRTTGRAMWLGIRLF
jgi:vitamin B12 transporter